MISDSDLKNDVESELQWDPAIDAEQIGVTVRNGVVTLSGFVRSFNEKWEAERVAMRVAGTIGIANDIKVDLPAIGQRPDPDIATDAVAALRHALPDEADGIRVVVKDGWVTLEGEVHWNLVKERAANAVRRVRGLKELINIIKVRSRIPPRELERKIKGALARSAVVDPARIVVEVRGDEVRLKGTVRSWAARDVAEKIARRAPGVPSVDNRISVQNWAGAEAASVKGESNGTCCK